jgi:hypothetical protein
MNYLLLICAELSLSGSFECAVRLQWCSHSDQSDIHNGTLASTGHGKLCCHIAHLEAVTRRTEEIQAACDD